MRLLLLALVPLQAQEVIHVDQTDYHQLLIERMCASIQKHEGCFSWNNPGCLAYAEQGAARKLSNGYARFDTMQAGEQALKADLIKKFERGMTVKQVMMLWNNGRYLSDLLRETGLAPNSKF